jgi:diguanylate cyclase (GGDEF)-like protein/PAS domain S-box-containing protein
MRLQQKTLIIVSLTSLALMTIAYLSSELTFTNNYRVLEENEAHRNIVRAASALADEISNLDTLNQSWAASDETYYFAQDRNPNFIEKVPTDNTFENARISLMVVTNSWKNLVFSKAFDLENRHAVTVPQTLEAQLKKEALYPQGGITSSVQGIILLSEGPMIISSRPVVTSEGTGPVVGTLLIGRYLSTTMIANLASTTGMSLSMNLFNNDMEPDFRIASASLSEQNPFFVKPINDNSMGAYTLINDIYGNRVIILGAGLPRPIYNQAKQAGYYFLLYVLGLGIAVALITVILLRGLVVSKLVGLSVKVRKIGKAQDLASRLPEVGNDEISELSRDINRMLVSIDRAQKSAYETEKKYRDLVERATDGIAIVKDRIFVYANPSLLKMSGYTQDELKNASASNYLPPDSLPLLFQTETVSENAAACETTFLHKSGRQVPVEVTAGPMSYEGDSAQLIFIRDISERKAAQDKLLEMATHDSLTGLPNRALLSDRFEVALAGARRSDKSLAIIILDLDMFKLVNDNAGHLAGDRLLIEVSRRLVEQLRETDTVARLGGDEFVILLTDIGTVIDAINKTDKILNSFAEPFPVDGVPLNVTASIGLAVFPQNGDDPETLLKAADDAMYRSKERGRNVYSIAIA